MAQAENGQRDQPDTTVEADVEEMAHRLGLVGVTRLLRFLVQDAAEAAGRSERGRLLNVAKTHLETAELFLEKAAQ
jgi:hypothetical protein